MPTLPDAAAAYRAGRFVRNAQYRPLWQVLAAVSALLFVLSACTASGGLSAEEGTTVMGTGVASYYGQALAGQPTASGEAFDPTDLTAAHRSLPFGSRVRVVNLRNDKDVVVRINDRGPFVDGRVIDLSRAAAEHLGMVRDGKVRVRLERVDVASRAVTDRRGTAGRSGW